MEYTIQRRVDGTFDDTVEATIDALEAAGFGVLCDIDVQATFAEKLDASFRQYRILGACNPALGHEALTTEVALGVLLPCNLVVYETDAGAIEVAAVDPTALVGMADDEALDRIAREVRERFEDVLASVADTADGATPER